MCEYIFDNAAEGIEIIHDKWPALYNNIIDGMSINMSYKIVRAFNMEKCTEFYKKLITLIKCPICYKFLSNSDHEIIEYIKEREYMIDFWLL